MQDDIFMEVLIRSNSFKQNLF